MNGTIIPFVSYLPFVRPLFHLSRCDMCDHCVYQKYKKTRWEKNIMNALLFFTNWPWINLSQLSGRFGLFKRRIDSQKVKRKLGYVPLFGDQNPFLIQVFSAFFCDVHKLIPNKMWDGRTHTHTHTWIKDWTSLYIWIWYEMLKLEYFALYWVLWSLLIDTLSPQTTFCWPNSYDYK